MSAKRFRSRRGNEADRFTTIVLLAISLIGGGCATTSSEVSKPHKPQMITSAGAEEVGTSDASKKFSTVFSLSDGWAGVLTVMGPVFEILGSFAANR